MSMPRNVVFAALASLLLCGPALLYASIRFAGMDLPPRVTSAEADYLAGNREAADVRATLLAGGYLTGDFQDAVGVEVENAIPFKADANLGHAAAQRALISVAAVAADYRCYPTFYGSRFAYDRELDVLWAGEPLRSDSPMLEDVERVGARLGECIRGTPQRWAYLVPNTEDLTAASPASGLVSDAIGYVGYCGFLKGTLPAECPVISCGYEDPEEYAGKFFMSDGHPQVLAGRDMYAALASHFGRLSDEVMGAEVYEAYSGGFMGGASRGGRMAEVCDWSVYDVAFGDANMRVLVDGSEREASFIDASYSLEGVPYEKRTRFDDVYVGWFHGDVGLIEMERPGYGGEPGAILVISDSMDNCWGRFLTATYERVYELDPRHYKSGTVQQFLSQHEDVVDVAIVIRDSTNSVFVGRLQDLFGPDAS